MENSFIPCVMIKNFFPTFSKQREFKTKTEQARVTSLTSQCCFYAKLD